MTPTPLNKPALYDTARAAFLQERADQVVRAAERAKHAERWVISSVRDAHDAGLSWAQIGELLGVTRQAAHKRFAPHIAA